MLTLVVNVNMSYNTSIHKYFVFNVTLQVLCSNIVRKNYNTIKETENSHLYNVMNLKSTISKCFCLVAKKRYQKQTYIRVLLYISVQYW